MKKKEETSLEKPSAEHLCFPANAGAGKGKNRVGMGAEVIWEAAARE